MTATWRTFFLISGASLSLALPSALQAERNPLLDGRIEGRVVDAETREPLPGVNILIPGTQRGAASDADGTFAITGLSPGTYRLEFRFIGYETVTRTDIVVTSGRPAILSVQMRIGVVAQEGITVTAGYFPEPPLKSLSLATLGAEEIRRFPGGFEDVVRVVATLPGVAAVSEGGRNDLLVRGGGPSENLYLINNVEVPNINHFGNQGGGSGALSYINLDFVDDVEFNAGGFSAVYGDKLSSVLAIRTRQARADAIGGKATISATQYGLNLEGPLGKSSGFLFSARRSYLDLIFKAAGLPFIPAYTDFNFFSEHSLGGNLRLTTLFLTALDRVGRDQSTLENRTVNAGILDNSQDQIVAGATLQRVRKNGYAEVSLGGTLNRFRFTQIDENETPYYRSRATESGISLKARLYQRLGTRSGIDLGAAFRTIQNENRTTFSDTIVDRSGNRVPISALGLSPEFGTDASLRSAALFASVEHTVFSGFQVEGGIRLNHYAALVDPFSLGARLTGSAAIAAGISFQLHLGRYHQPPSAVWLTNPANRGLRALRSDAAIAGLEFRLAPDLKFRVEGYRKWYSDLPSGSTPGVNDYLVVTNTGVGYGGREDDFQSFGYFPMRSVGSGRAEGVEISIQKKLADIPVYGQGSISIGRSEYTAANGMTYPGQFDQRLVMNLSGGWKPDARWEFAAKIRYFSGAPFTPVYVPASNAGRTVNLPDEYLSRRLEATYLLDIRGDHHWNFANWTLTLFVDIQNVLNRKIQTRPEYDFWEMRIDDRADLGILPSIGISATF